MANAARLTTGRLTVSASNLASSISALNQAIEFVKEELLIVRKCSSAHPLDRFVMVMEVFVAESAPAMAALNSMSQQLDRDLCELLRYFGEDPSSMKAEEFFGIISSFSVALQVSLSFCGLHPTPILTVALRFQRADDEIRDAERLATKGTKSRKVRHN